MISRRRFIYCAATGLMVPVARAGLPIPLGFFKPRGSSSPYSVLPTDFAGLGPWWKADSLSLNNGDPVSTWTDSNGSNNATGTTTTRPLYTTNVFGTAPALSFDGTDDILSTTSDVGTFFLDLTWTTMVVFAWASGAGTGMILGINGSTYGTLLGFIGGACLSDNVTTQCVSNFTTVATVPMLMTNRRLNFRENKTDRGAVTGGFNAGTSFAYNRIGKWSLNTFYFNGFIAEIAIWPAVALSDADCDNLYNNYFKVKYTTLP